MADLDRELAARVRGAGRPAAGISPWPAREKGFPSNLLLNFNCYGWLSVTTLGRRGVAGVSHGLTGNHRTQVSR